MVTPRMCKTKNLNVLIADDDEALRESLGKVLEPMGFTVYLASGGSGAVSVAEERSIDIAILDVNMPDLSGIEAMRIIRRSRSSVGCIFITSEGRRSVERRAASAGSYTIVRKPIRIESLRYAIREMASRYEERREMLSGERLEEKG